MSSSEGAALRSAWDVNHHYFFSYVSALQNDLGPLRVLDFGCGQGSHVRLLRAAGVECVGADVFYGGHDWDDPELAELLAAGIVHRIPYGGSLPFPDASFDVVFTDQVLEHVEDLAAVMKDLDRVLRRGGRMYHHFPTLETLREAHLGMPLLHRLPPGRARWRYVLTLRRLGLGTYKDGLPAEEWTSRGLDWLDRYCHYRGVAEITAQLDPRYVIAHREIDYCLFRAQDRAVLRRALAVRPLQGAYARLFRRLAFVAIEGRKL